MASVGFYPHEEDAINSGAGLLIDTGRNRKTVHDLKSVTE